MKNLTSSHTKDTKYSLDDNGDMSFLSRDGDPTIYTNISMSTPEFGKYEDMPPPRSAKHPQSFHIPVATQAMSQWSDNPLEALLQPQVPDDLPSTKPCSEEDAKNNTARGDGTQDEMDAALQIADGLLAGADVNEADTKATITHDIMAYERMNELAGPSINTTKSRSSRKRTQDELNQNEAASRTSVKTKSQADLEEDDAFSDLPTERYQPRKSRSRAVGLGNDVFESIDFSKRPEARKRGGKKNTGRRHTTGGAVVVQLDDEDGFEAIEKETFTPAKSRSRKGKVTAAEKLEDSAHRLKDEAPKACLQSHGHDDDITVTDTTKTFEDLGDGENEEAIKDVDKKKRTKKGRQTTTGSKGLLSADEISYSKEEPSTEHDLPVEEELAQNSVEQLPGQASQVAVEATLLEELSKRPKKSRKPKATRTKTKDRSTSHVISESVEMTNDDKSIIEKNMISKKDTVEVIDLPSSSVASPSKNDGNLRNKLTSPLHDEGQPDNPTETKEKSDISTKSEGHIKPQPLSDTTNTTLTPEQNTPDQSNKSSSAAKPDPTKKTRSTYRVGLSRLSRIEPLLKIVRKDKAVPAVNPALKKGKK